MTDADYAELIRIHATKALESVRALSARRPDVNRWASMIAVRQSLVVAEKAAMNLMRALQPPLPSDTLVTTHAELGLPNPPTETAPTTARKPPRTP